MQSPARSSSSKAAMTRPTVPPLLRSCDRCHSLKERCDRKPNSSHCARCQRLQLNCVAERPIKRSVRRPQLQSKLHPQPPLQSQPPWPVLGSIDEGTIQSQSIAQALAQPIRAVAGTPPPQQPATTHESNAADLLWLVDSVNSIEDGFFGNFVLGPTWFRAHRQALLSNLCAAHLLLRDAFLACFLLFPSQSDPHQVPSADDVARSYASASVAVDKLRCITVASPDDASSCFALGTLLLTFAHRLGNESYHICVQILGSVKPILEAALDPPPDYSFFMCIVLSEMEECLIRATVPTLRLPPTVVDQLGVDRYCGVSASLMPLLYDLCCVNSLMKRAEEVPDAAQQLDAVETAIRDWRPPALEGFPTAFTDGEISCLLGYANTMQAAALLVIHRLRYPFGSVDSAALALSTSFVMQIEAIHLVYRRAMPSVGLPLFVACAELHDEAERSRLLRYSSLAAFSSPYRGRRERMLSALWERRQHDPSMRWCDLGSLLYPPT